MQTHLEDHKQRGFFFVACMTFLPGSFSAESCTLNFLYGISNLRCLINQCELEYRKSSLVTRAFSAKSYTSDTDRPSLAQGVAECKNEDCMYLECKIWQREHE